MPWHPLERAALVAALDAAGPAAPTLCEGWSSRHLAAHVHLRESSALAAGIGVPQLAGRTEAATLALGDRHASPLTYGALVERVAEGPPRWHPVRLVGDAGNLLELFVHTEDVRRGATLRETPARTRSSEHAAALWSHLRPMARALLRRSPVGVVLETPLGSVRAARPTERGDVVVRGELDEVVLHAFGRRAAARVEVDGEPAAVAAYTARDS